MKFKSLNIQEDLELIENGALIIYVKEISKRRIK